MSRVCSKKTTSSQGTQIMRKTKGTGIRDKTCSGDNTDNKVKLSIAAK